MESDCTVFEGWTKTDKFTLLQVLKRCGSGNISAFCEELPEKSADQIKSVITYYKRKALKHPIIVDRKRRGRSDVNSIPRIPLACWAKVLTDARPFEELQTETATALRLIAELETMPTTLCTGNIDFRKIYHIIANAVEGKSLQDDKMAISVIDKCIMETALISKSFMRNSALKEILHNIDVNDKDVNYFNKPTTENELSSLRHLASQKNYNPLPISEEHLKYGKL